MASAAVTVRSSIEDRTALGKGSRVTADLSSHTGWVPAGDRRDPVTLLEEQDASREQDLVPVRHGRMMVSPFTFYRGAGKIMAADLKDTPRAGLDVQLCGDAHLSNFGMFASPERALMFDLNDFDESLPGPFEYDVKRLAASFSIAGRNNGYSEADTRAVTVASARAYREATAGFAQMGTMEIWYAHLSEQELVAAIRNLARGDTAGGKKGAKKIQKKARKSEKGARAIMDKARTRDSLQALSKLAEPVDGGYRIVSQPPIVIPLRDVPSSAGMSADDVSQAIDQQFRAYRGTLRNDQRRLLERFEIIDVARKVVGVGSVGTRAYIALLQGRDQGDPLFLQVKEATTSVLEDHLPKSRFKQPGERVVQGQRMMQAASDIFLGWTKGVVDDRFYYWRQLRDMKGSVVVESMAPANLAFYAHACAWTLARAHARSGDPIAIASYLGKSDRFDRSIADFSGRYADQNEEDYEAFVGAVRSGRLEASEASE